MRNDSASAGDAELLFATLQRPSASVGERKHAFDRLLRLRSGWWGDEPLMVFLTECAQYTIRRRSAVIADDAEDIAQFVLLDFFRHASRIYGGPRGARGWLLGAVRIAVLRAAERSRAETEIARFSMYSPRVQSTRTVRALKSAIRTLTPTLARVVELRIRRYDLSLAAIAAELGISHASARQAWTRARRQLRVTLTPTLTAAKAHRHGHSAELRIRST